MSFLGSRFASGSGKTSTPSKQHARSSSLSTLDTATSPVTPQTPSTTKWRPSVLGYFSSSQISMDPSEALYAPPRPSMSSTHTGTSTATFIASPSFTTPSVNEKETPVTPTKIFGLKSRRHSHGNLLQTARVSTILEGSDSGSCRAKTEAAKANSVRLPFAPKPTLRMINRDACHDDDDDDPVPVQTSKSRPEVAFSSSGKSGTMPRVALSALSTRNQKKKKKLVISGVASNDTRKFEGVKRWCEVRHLLAYATYSF